MICGCCREILPSLMHQIIDMFSLQTGPLCTCTVYKAVLCILSTKWTDTAVLTIPLISCKKYVLVSALLLPKHLPRSFTLTQMLPFAHLFKEQSVLSMNNPHPQNMQMVVLHGSRNLLLLSLSLLSSVSAQS